MSITGIRTALPIVLGAMICTPLAASPRFPKPLPAEPLMKLSVLPARYPDGWVFLDYSSERI